MSSTRKIRELNGGRLTRPRGLWSGKPRGARRTSRDELAQQQAARQRSAAALLGLANVITRRGRQSDDRRATS